MFALICIKKRKARQERKETRLKQPIDYVKFGIYRVSQKKAPGILNQEVDFYQHHLHYIYNNMRQTNRQMDIPNVLIEMLHMMTYS